jgi:hypothetical protein
MSKIQIPSGAMLRIVDAHKWPKTFTEDQAKEKFGSDIFDRIAEKGKHSQKRMRLCNKHVNPCMGSMLGEDGREVFSYGYFEWEMLPLSEDEFLAACWPYKSTKNPGWGIYPKGIVTITDFGKTEIHHTVAYQNMEAVWIEEFQNV